MAPPGRRRNVLPLSSILALVLLFLSPSTLAASAVLGIDIGTEYIKAALVKPGIPLEIVLTKDSKRKETSAIAFKASTSTEPDAQEFPERLYGGDALALAPRIPGDVYPNLKHILGVAKPYGDAAVQGYKRRYPALGLVEDEKLETLGFRSKNFGSEGELFSVEELLGMELRGIRENAETMAGSGSLVRDVVISVPTFYTADEKRAIEAAAELAGMKVVGLLSDGLAVGLNYATLRTFGNPDEGGKAEHHLVYDMGAGSTTATVLRFQARTVKDVGRYNKTIQEVTVLGAGWDRSLGGDALNDLIVDDMVTQFIESKGAKALQLDAASVKSHGRTVAKLNREAERVRQVLSANTATSAFFEGLQEDVDFRYKLSRTEFESLASSVVNRVSEPITIALTKAGLSLSDLDSIILHGGAVRTPFVQSSLESLISDPAKLKNNVNADEAAVFGAAFKAASLSPSFRVKEIRTRDIATYPVTVHWLSNGKLRRQNIFLPTSTSGTLKQMPFKLVEDFSLSISQDISDQSTEEPIVKALWEVKITNLTASVDELVNKYACVRSNISVALGFQIEPSRGLPEVLRGTASCESDVAEKKSGGVVDDVKGFFGFGSKKDQKPLEDGEGDDLETEVVSELPSETSTSTGIGSGTSAPSASATKKEDKTKKDKLHTFNLSFDMQRVGAPTATKEEVQRIKDRLAAFDKSDLSRRRREEVFNKLEGFTYRVRDMLSDSSFMDVSSSDQRGAIETLLGTTSEWISSEGAQASYNTIKEKLSGLTSLVDPVQQRKAEMAKRPQSIELLQEALNQTQNIMRIVREQVDSAVASASAAAEAALSSLTETETESATESATETESAAPTAKPDDDLDDFESETSSTTTTATSSKPWQLPDLSIFTEDDYSRLASVYESVKDWFGEQSAAQALLGPSEDPALSTSELEKRAQKLTQISNELLRKLTKPSYKRPKASSTKSKVKVPKPSASTVKSTKGEGSTSSKVEDKASAAETATSSDDGKIRIPTPRVSFVTPKGASSSASSTVEAEASPSGTSEDIVSPAETVASSIVTDEQTPAPEPVEETKPRDEL